MKKIAVFLAMLCLVSVADANYYFSGGYYYYPGSSQAYTRTSYYHNGYYNYGVYYPGYYSYQYQPYYAPATYTPPAVAADWRVEQMRAVAAVAKVKATADAVAQENKAYLDSLKALGLNGLLAPGLSPGYGNGTVPQYVLPGYTTSGHYYNNSLFGANASTIYGYPQNGFNAQAAIYQDSYVAGLYQMANQQAVNSQALTDKATTGFQDLVSREGVARSQVATINAKRDFAIAMLKAMESPSISQQGFKFTITPQGIKTDASAVDSETKAKVAEQFQVLITNKCARCHSTPDARQGIVMEGGFNVFEYTKMTPEAKQAVMERLEHKDPQKRMPLKDKTTPGEPLVPEEKRLFAIH